MEHLFCWSEPPHQSCGVTPRCGVPLAAGRLGEKWRRRRKWGARWIVFLEMAFYSDHHFYAIHPLNVSVVTLTLQGFRYEEESNNYAPQQFYSAPIHVPQHLEICLLELNGPPFGQQITLALNDSLEQSHVHVPTQDEFDEIEKITHLSLEFTWSAEDDPIRKVIVEKMKKIKSGKELVEEVRKIEKNMNVGSTISSLLELSVFCDSP
ncbi:hypothetical protein TRIUR3_31161 [Triticum urartu]|uniref:Uncharacterized protein n=1 Tax=Triticum urartu TaxID=4572 RepID=M7ZDZ5_TRIUA|nr:hypothetical protein TRIUR3_31161 [Triticum urartu]